MRALLPPLHLSWLYYSHLTRRLPGLNALPSCPCSTSRMHRIAQNYPRRCWGSTLRSAVISRPGLRLHCDAHDTAGHNWPPSTTENTYDGMCQASLLQCSPDALRLCRASAQADLAAAGPCFGQQVLAGRHHQPQPTALEYTSQGVADQGSRRNTNGESRSPRRAAADITGCAGVVSECRDSEQWPSL